MNTDRPTERPRVLLLTPWAPYPLDGGSKRGWSLCRELKDRYSFTLLTFASRPEGARAAADDMLREHQYLRPVFDKVVWVDRREDRDVRPPEELGLPEDVARFYSPAMERALAETLERERPALLHVEYDLMSPYARLAPGLPRVITQHDVGTISFFHSYFREMAGWRKFGRVLSWARRVRYERRAMGWFERIVVCTEPDARRLAHIAPREKIRAIQTGVDLGEFSPATAAGGESLAFVGHYPHFPNEDAALYFAREVLPLVRARRPRARFLAVGSSPTPAIQALSREPGIVVTGTVPSVAPFLRQATVFVAPIRLGQGIKGKLLEAVAAGVPVVASRCAADGLGARHGRELEIADDPRGFADAVLRLLDDPALRAERAEAALEFVRRRYAWPALAPRLGEVYRELIGEDSGVPA